MTPSHNNSSKKLAFLGSFLGLALILSYVESLIPFYFGVPGMKLGLPNLCILIVLYMMDEKSAILINVVRVLLVGILFGNMFSVIFSLAGAGLSFLSMWIMKRSGKFRLITVSTVGGIFHNIGQILAASIVVSNYHLYLYLPFLFIAGAVTGFVIGIVAERLIQILSRYMDR